LSDATICPAEPWPLAILMLKNRTFEIKVTAQTDGTFTVTNTRNGFSKTCAPNAGTNWHDVRPFDHSKLPCGRSRRGLWALAGFCAKVSLIAVGAI
jgi:hypothetical protein